MNKKLIASPSTAAYKYIGTPHRLYSGQRYKSRKIEQGTSDTGQTPDTDELKFDKNAIQKIMKYH